jgi:RimJ/RimL family protein N-acetyltransferase
MTASKLRLVATMLRTEGPLEVIRRLAFRFLHVHTFAVLRLPLSAALPRGEAPPGIELKEVSTADLNALRLGRSDLPEYFYRDQSETLDRCWAGLKDGKLGFIVWISSRGSSNLVRLGVKDVELAYIYCLEPLRGQRLTTNAVLVIARALFEEGFASMLAVPHSGNAAIIKSFQACGFERLGSIRRFGFVTWPRTPADYSRLGVPRRVGP